MLMPRVSQPSFVLSPPDVTMTEAAATAAAIAHFTVPEVGLDENPEERQIHISKHVSL